MSTAPSLRRSIHGRRRTLLLAAALLPLVMIVPIRRATAQEGPGPGEDEPTYRIAEAGDQDLGPILEAIGRAAGAPVVVDPQLPGALPVSAPGDYTFDALQALLLGHDVRLVWVRGPGEAVTVHAVLRRNLATFLMERQPRILEPGEAMPDVEEYVELHVPVQNGAGNEIFAVIRGLLTSDRERTGNVLYVRGAEQIILVDLASKVRRCAEVITYLDVPVSPAGSTSLRVQVELWTGPREALAPLAGLSPAEARERLEQTAGATGGRSVRRILALAHDAGQGQSTIDRTVAETGAGTGGGGAADTCVVRRLRLEERLVSDGEQPRSEIQLAIERTSLARNAQGELAATPDAWRLSTVMPLAAAEERIYLDVGDDSPGARGDVVIVRVVGR